MLFVLLLTIITTTALPTRLLSEGKPVTSSPIYEHPKFSYTWPAENAVKDLSNLETECDYAKPGSVVLLAGSNRWLQVDLETTSTVSKIQLIGEKKFWYSHCKQVQFSVCTNADGTGCQPCGGVIPHASNNLAPVEVTCNVEGQYVRLDNPYANGNWHFCRIQVFGTAPQACEEGISFSETGDDSAGDCQPCTSCSTTETAACTVTSDTDCATPCEEGTSFSETGDDAGGVCQSCNPCSDYGVSEMCTLTSDTVCLTCDDVLESMNSQIESLQTQYADAQAAFDANMKAMYETKYNQLNPFDVLHEPVNVALLALSVVGLISIGYIAGNRKSNNWKPIPEV